MSSPPFCWSQSPAATATDKRILGPEGSWASSTICFYISWLGGTDQHSWCWFQFYTQEHVVTVSKKSQNLSIKTRRNRLQACPLFGASFPVFLFEQNKFRIEAFSLNILILVERCFLTKRCSTRGFSPCQWRASCYIKREIQSETEWRSPDRLQGPDVTILL